MHPYLFTTSVRQDDALRTAFNDLAHSCFDIDFLNWYQAGYWGEHYVPHALIQDSAVISNVSVNHMVFHRNGQRKYYIQLGTVMTAPEFRGQGLNRQLIEKVLAEYGPKADGFYLFANDSALDYYPKFGFRQSQQTEYYLPDEAFAGAAPYALQTAAPEDFYGAIRRTPHNPNDGLYLQENLGLYQYWCGVQFGSCVHFLPEADAFIVADREGTQLRIHQIIGSKIVDLRRLAASFPAGIREAVLGFTPGNTDGLSCRPHQEPGSTLFVLGDDLNCIETEKLIFPTLSHA